MVARGKRSAAPGMLVGTRFCALKGRKTSRKDPIGRLASFQDAVLILYSDPGAALRLPLATFSHPFGMPGAGDTPLPLHCS